MSRIWHLVWAAGLFAVSNSAVSGSFSVGEWHSYVNSCSAHRVYPNSQSQLSFGLYVNDDNSQHVVFGVERKSWTAYKTVSIRIDGHMVSQKSEMLDLGKDSPRHLSIDLGPRAGISGVLQHAKSLAIDNGAEVLTYDISDVPLVFAKSDECMKTSDDIPAVPPPTAVPVLADDGLAYCGQTTDFVIYHGSWDREPTAKERAGMREYAQKASRCISLWRQRCTPLMLMPQGSTYAFCNLEADTARAHVDNHMSLALRGETYLQYNQRGVDIDNTFTQASNRVFEGVQRSIDDYARQEQNARERKAAAQREEELLSILRQIRDQSARGSITNCIGNGDGQSFQCISR
jgi:hypothetical protein